MIKINHRLAAAPAGLRCVALFSILVTSLVVKAQTLTLDQALKETRSDSLQIQKAESSYEEAKWRKKGAYSGYLPSLTGSVNYLTDKKYMFLDVNLGGGPLSIPQVVPTTLYTLKATLPVFDGFSSTNRLRSESALEDSARQDYEWTQFTVERQTTLQFYRTLAAQTLKDVAEQNMKALQDHLKDIQAFKKAGVSTNYDVLRVEVQVSEAQSELLNSQDNVELAKFKLGESMGKETETRQLAGKLPVLSEDLIRKLDEKSVETRPDIQSLQKKSEASHYSYQSANRYWVPRISLIGEFDHYNNRNDRFQDADGFRDSYMAGINLTWNIFDGMISPSRSGQAEQQSLQVEKSLGMARIKAKQDFEYWKRKYLYFCTVYKSRLSDIDRSKESVRLAQEGRRAGVRTSTELLDAESDLFRSRAGLITAQMGAIEALVNLELVSGQKLFDFN
jgi:outer membrane protein TolC